MSLSLDLFLLSQTWIVMELTVIIDKILVHDL